MRLSTRLLLIVLACLVPVIGAEIFNQVDLYEQQQDQLEANALRHVESVNRAVGEIVDGARQAASIMAAFPSVQAQLPACGAELAALLPHRPSYLFLAVLNEAGHVTCASAPELATSPPGAVAGFRPRPGQEVGDYSLMPVSGMGGAGAFLPVYAPMPSGGTFVLALDLRWLARHLQDTQLDSMPLLSGALLLTDRHGSILVRYPDNAVGGRELPPELRQIITGVREVSRIITDQLGHRQLAVVVPEGVSPEGLATIELLPLNEVMERANTMLRRAIIVIAGAAVVALALAWLVGRRFVSRPAQNLRTALEALGRGDLQARADGGRHGEFAALARSVNALAENLEARERTRGLETELLQAQLMQRTRDLSENNNRLQVEIAEREKTEAALTHAQKLQVVGQLSGGIAHDFNNMLATVLGSLELMERRVGQNPRNWTDADVDRLRTLIERATGAVQRGAQLTSGLLAFSRRQRVTARATDLNKLIEELGTLATSTLGRRIRLTTELDEAPWAALVDPSQVEAALLNLCLNARDAMPDGGTLTIRTSNVTISAGTLGDEPPPGPYVCISVADTGAGMAPEVQRRAFDPLFTTKGNAGSGLGLNQVNQMVRQANGSVRLRSTPGRGTEVTLLLPRAASEATPENAPRPAAPATRRGGPTATVLVVDDDYAVRQVTVEMLRDLSCDVHEVGSGSEALALLEELETPPDIILLDYAMPGMNGLTLARRLREDGVGVPIALVTGYAELNELEGGDTPLDGLLRKPFTIEELQALLTRLGGTIRLMSNVVRLPVPHRRC